MSKIIKLPVSVIAQIAAGQVVDRPVSIVKELVENAVDAGAENITIQLIDGGKKSITVTDDGCGMTAAELELAIQPHTTSKIATVEDLQNITTLGFRGEALSSITQAAAVVIQTRTPEQSVGTQLVIRDRVVQQPKPVGMAVGTTVIVTELFQTLPARYKFLKSTRAELQLTLEAVTQLAYAHTNVGFRLFHNDQLLLDLLPQQLLYQRLLELLGDQFSTLFLPVELQVSDIKISGYIGKPQAATTLTQRQVLLVNGRPVIHTAITKTIRRAFKTLLPPSIQPPFVLYLTVDPSTIDVNIHPQKREVKFAEEGMLLQVLAALIQDILTKANLLFSFQNQDALVLQDSGMEPGTAAVLREATTLWNVKEFFDTEPILQIDSLYLVAATKHGFLLIDQHAAHERILYEQLLQTYQDTKPQAYKLPQPQGISLPILEAELLTEHTEFFVKLGFKFARISPTQFQFLQVPVYLKERQLSRYLLEVLQDLAADTEVPELDLQTHRTIAYLACRNAIKAGEVLTQQERQNLVTKLLQTNSKYTCPHGRPVLIELHQKDLEKLFYRIPAFRNEK